MSTPLPVEPRIVERNEQPYVAIKGLITMETFGEIADRLPEVLAWLRTHEIAPAVSPFFKYNVIDMERQLEVEAGFPVAALVEGDSEVLVGVLPAGRFATVSHVGHPDELIDVTASLLDWAAQQDLEWDMVNTTKGQAWGCQLEELKTDPSDEPDMDKWETQLAFRLTN